MRKKHKSYHWHTLSDEDVQYIKEHYKPKDREYGITALAYKYVVGQTTISAIVHGKYKKGDELYG